MSLLRAAGTGMQRKNRVGSLAIPTSSFNYGSVTTVRKFVGDPFDRYLARLGLVKKAMPNDKGSSLYRAVCESLSMDQREHVALQQFVEDHLLFQYHIQRIEEGLPHVNKIEDTLATLANLLSVDLHVYRGIGEKPVIYRGSSEGEAAEKVMLCETSRGHFDLVITREDHTNLALAQTILYEALYVGVFGFSRDVIKESVDKVREDMDTVGVDVQTPKSDYLQGRNGDFSFSDGESGQPCAPTWRPPIPYSSVKALDPSVYRNLAYDLYLRNKKRSVDRGDFQSGSPCFVVEGESFYRACVLSVPDKNSRLVSINGIERKVNVSKLLPLPGRMSPNRSLPYNSPSSDTETLTHDYSQLRERMKISSWPPVATLRRLRNGQCWLSSLQSSHTASNIIERNHYGFRLRIPMSTGAHQRYHATQAFIVNLKGCEMRAVMLLKNYLKPHLRSPK